MMQGWLRRLLVVTLFVTGAVATVVATLNIRARGLNLEKGVILTAAMVLCVLLFDDLRHLYRPIVLRNRVRELADTIRRSWAGRKSWGAE
jgi:hypothetical protein